MDEYTANFEKGCLIKVSTSVWPARKKLDKDAMSAIGNTEYLSGGKSLVNPEAFKEIRAVVTKAKAYVKALGLPFPIDGINFVPKQLIVDIDEYLTRCKEEFTEAVRLFNLKFEDLKLDARKYLVDHYDPKDYDIDLEKKFSFSWQFVILGAPDQGVLPVELYKQEVEKFKNLMKEASEMAVDALRVEFSDLVTHMVERLTPAEDGKKKVIKDSVVENIYGFFDLFEKRNIFQDETLKEIVQQAKAVIGGVKPEDLRVDESLRTALRDEMAQIKRNIDEAIVPASGRRIKLPGEAQAA
jgi:hypothetical protein